MNHKMLSLADQVFEQLERAILVGDYKRDEVLTEVRLSESRGVSRTPIREAIYRLGQERLVEMTGKGARVIGISAGDIADIYEIRLRLEGLCCRRAAEHGDEEQLQALRETLELQEFYTQKGDADGIMRMDNRFHQTVYDMCGSAPLRDTLEPLHRRVVKYRQVSVSTPGRAERSLAEHRKIFEAIEAGNGNLAEKTALELLKNARDSILSERKA